MSESNSSVKGTAKHPVLSVTQLHGAIADMGHTAQL